MSTPAHFRCVLSSLCALVCFAQGCGSESSARIDPSLPSMNSREVGTAMSGNYSNEAQAKADAKFDSIVMHMRPIWVDRIDGLWMYVEQSLATKLDNPYRQRVYQIVDGNYPDSVEVRIYELPGDLQQYAGEWKKDRPLRQLMPDLLLSQPGCNVTMRLDDSKAWIGSTEPNQCAATTDGAAYSMSSVKMTQKEIQSWDRTYDSNGKQVSGSTTGPYIFVKTSR